MKILVAITSFGEANDRYLSQVIGEYRSMPFDIDIVVLSNLKKDVPAGVELVVGLPAKDPWSLPFAHKAVLAARASRHDLFIYSEDDILITEKNIRAFVSLSEILPASEIPGFLRFEVGPDGKRSFPEFHVNFRWEPGSLRSRSGHTLAFLTNQHAGCYALTQDQLRRAIASGGFLVPPHQEAYDLACTAATDPYTQCGFKKLIAVSHLEDFLVHHLPNKYAGQYGLHEDDFDSYLRALLASGSYEETPLPLRTDSAIPGRLFSKNYYEPVRHDLISLLPEQARTVLSAGCGWGATEACLAQTGRRVLVSALDPVMAKWAESRGLEPVAGDMAAVQERLAGEEIDCLLISNVLHLADDPTALLDSFVSVLCEDVTVIAAMPSLGRIKAAWKRLHDRGRCRFLGNFEKTKIHNTSHRIVRDWFEQAGIRVEQFLDLVPPRLDRIDSLTLGALRPLLASEIVVVGRTKWTGPLRERARNAKLESPVLVEAVG